MSNPGAGAGDACGGPGARDSDIAFRKALLESQTEASPDGILVVSPAGEMVSFNRRFVRMWGIPEDVVASRSDEAALRSVLDKLVDPAGFLAKVEHLYQHEAEESLDEIALKDGRIFERFSAPVRGDDGVHFGRVWLFRDVSAQRHAERERALHLERERQARAQAEQAIRMREDLIAAVSHDLKNPLAVAQLNAHLVERLTLEGGDRTLVLDSAQKILESIVRMQHLIRDLLDMALIDAGLLGISLQRQVVDRLVGDAVEMLRPLATDRAQRLEVQVPDGEVAVLGDRERLLRVFSNVVGNAIKFTPSGGRITVLARRAGSEVYFAVTDTGPGIARDRIPFVFDRFWRGSSNRQAGTGLGLFIARGIVDAHGGRIWVESAPGGGATVCFTVAAAEG